MDREFLFVKTLEDIEEKLSKRDTYNSLMLAALLRKLIIDGSKSLLHQVNQKYRMTIRFTANDLLILSPVHEITFLSLEDSTDPESCTHMPLKRPVSLKIDKFLKHTVMICNGHMITVQKLIDNIAHVQGGVHAGNATSSIDCALEELSNSLFVGNLPAGMNTLRGVASIVLRGLDPLLQQVINPK